MSSEPRGFCQALQGRNLFFVAAASVTGVGAFALQRLRQSAKLPTLDQILGILGINSTSPGSRRGRLDS